MAGKQAKLLTDDQQILLLTHVSSKRQPHRDRVLILLSFKAGLRAAEIAKLTWEMVLDPSGAIGDGIEVRDEIAKKGGCAVLLLAVGADGLPGPILGAALVRSP